MAYGNKMAGSKMDMPLPKKAMAMPKKAAPKHKPGTKKYCPTCNRSVSCPHM